MAGFVPSTPTQDIAALRAQVQRAARSSSPREELEHLMGDVGAEILLLEVDLRRVERQLLAPTGPRIQPRDVQAQLELRGRLEVAVEDMRELAGQIRAYLRSAA